MIEDTLILSNIYYSKSLIVIYTLATLDNFVTLIINNKNINNKFMVNLIKNLLYN